MAEQLIRTDREKEAIYEYSDASPINISIQANVTIQIFFSGGQRRLEVTDNGLHKQYSLTAPKKPETTPTNFILKLGAKEYEISEELSRLFPAVENAQ
jgi:hypothetical protein